MSPTLTTFLFEAANFLILAAVLAWLFFRPVRDALDRRQAALQRQDAESAEKLAEAERLQSEARQRLDQLEQDLEERSRRARRAARDEADRILHDARERAKQELAAARHRLAQLQQAEQSRLADVIARTTAATVARLLQQLAHPQLQDALVDAACREVRDLPRDALAPVRIESAQPLSDNARARLEQALGTAADSAEFRIVDDLGSGVRIATNHGLIDASTTGLATYARQTLEHILATVGPEQPKPDEPMTPPRDAADSQDSQSSPLEAHAPQHSGDSNDSRQTDDADRTSEARSDV